MAPVGIGAAWIGYTLIYFGVCSLKGKGVGLLDLVIPGRTVIIPHSGIKPVAKGIAGGIAGGVADALTSP